MTKRRRTSGTSTTRPLRKGKAEPAVPPLAQARFERDVIIQPAEPSDERPRAQVWVAWDENDEVPIRHPSTGAIVKAGELVEGHEVLVAHFAAALAHGWMEPMTVVRRRSGRYWVDSHPDQPDRGVRIELHQVHGEWRSSKQMFNKHLGPKRPSPDGRFGPRPRKKPEEEGDR